MGMKIETVTHIDTWKIINWWLWVGEHKYRRQIKLFGGRILLGYYRVNGRFTFLFGFEPSRKILWVEDEYGNREYK